MGSDNKVSPNIAFIWSFIDKMLGRFLQLVLSIFMARLVAPEAYGLIATMVVFVEIAQALIDSGFGSALIQRVNATHDDESSIFYFNIALGAVIALLLVAFAQLIAKFYAKPVLVYIAYAMAANLFINSFGIVHTALLTKRLDFKTLTKISVISNTSAGVIGLVVAYLGKGVLALVVQYLATSLISIALLWTFNTWRPKLSMSVAALGSMFRFGSQLLLSGCLGVLYNNTLPVLVGRFFSMDKLGFYNRASQLQQVPTGILSGALQRVIFPHFSSISLNDKKLKNSARIALRNNCLITFPTLIGFAMAADSIIVVLLTEKWAPCIPMFRVLCFVGLFDIPQVINQIIILSKGKSGLFFKLDIFKKCVGIPILIGTYQFGVMGMLYGQVVSVFIGYLGNIFCTNKFIHYPLAEQFVDILPAIVSGVIVGGLIWCAGKLGISVFLRLILQVGIGLVYIGVGLKIGFVKNPVGEK